MSDEKQTGGNVNATPNSQGNGVTPPTGQVAQPTPPVQSGAQGDQPANNDPKMVPLTALHEERQQRQALQDEVRQLRTWVDTQHQQQIQPQVPQQVGVPYQYQQSATANPQAQLDEMWEKDPRKGFQAEMGTALQMRDYADNIVEDQIDQAHQKYKDFGKYERQIRRAVRQIPINQRLDRNRPVIDTTYFFIKGQNADNLVQQGQDTTINRVKAGQAVQGIPTGTYTAPATSGGPQMTVDELKIAEVMNMTPEDYLKYKKVS